MSTTYLFALESARENTRLAARAVRLANSRKP